MGYKIVKLQNSHPPIVPTISISKDDEGWEQAYNNWLQGKDPTNSPLWKSKGSLITALTELIPEVKH